MLNIFKRVFARKKRDPDAVQGKEKLPSSRVTVDPGTQYVSGTGTSWVSRPASHEYFRESLDNIRYYESPSEVINYLAKHDPDVSNAIWNFLRTADSGLSIEGYNSSGSPSRYVQGVLDKLVGRLNQTSIDQYNEDKSLDIICSRALKLLLVRGGFCLELVLGGDKRLADIKVIDPKTIEFKYINGRYVPFQRFEGKDVSLDYPTIFWSVLDEDVSSPYEVSPFLSSINTVFFRIEVLRDLEKVLKRAGHPRIKAVINEEVLIRNMPQNIRSNPEQSRAWLNSRKTELMNYLNDLAPESAIAHWDSVELGYLHDGYNGRIDPNPLMEVLDQQISSALKTLPSILGRTKNMSQNTSSTESVLYTKSVKTLQKVFDNAMSKLFTFALRLEGVQGRAVVKHKEIDLRSPIEIENHLLMKQKRLSYELALGFRTPEEVCFELTGHRLPPGFDEDVMDRLVDSLVGKKVSNTGEAKDDNGNYNQQPEEKDVGEDSKTEAENPENIVTIAKRGQVAK